MNTITAESATNGAAMVLADARMNSDDPRRCQHIRTGSRRVRHQLFVIALLLFPALAGCGDGPKGGPRITTYPIEGVVTVDGVPTEQIQVICHPVGESKVPTGSAAYTDAEGKFSIGTYESGDGAPAGEYKLTFMWGKINLMTGRYEGPDKLNGRYSDVEKSTFEVTVKENEKVPVIAAPLTTE